MAAVAAPRTNTTASTVKNMLFVYTMTPSCADGGRAAAAGGSAGAHAATARGCYSGGGAALRRRLPRVR